MFRSLTRWPLCGLLACCLGLAGCAGGMQFQPGRNTTLSADLTPITAQLVQRQQSERVGRNTQDISALTGAIQPYHIGPGDILSVVVWGHPELATAMLNGQTPLIGPAEQAAAAAAPFQGFVVSEQGQIQYPFVGALTVAELTEQQAREQLARQLARYINAPNVTLRVQAFRSRRIYVDGEVKTPGVQAINDIPMTLVEALNRAGGVLPSGDQSHIAVVRDGVRHLINVPALVQQGIDPARIVLRHGDVVRVASGDESKVFVSGEVMTPRALVMHNGRLTLNEALGEAGGINPISGDVSQVYVVRRDAGQSQVYHLDAKDPAVMALAENFELSARDVVFVGQTGLSNWHRTLSQMIPGALTSAVSAGKQ